MPSVRAGLMLSGDHLADMDASLPTWEWKGPKKVGGRTREAGRLQLNGEGEEHSRPFGCGNGRRRARGFHPLHFSDGQA